MHSMHDRAPPMPTVMIAKQPVNVIIAQPTPRTVGGTAQGEGERCKGGNLPLSRPRNTMGFSDIAHSPEGLCHGMCLGMPHPSGTDASHAACAPRRAYVAQTQRGAEDGGGGPLVYY